MASKTFRAIEAGMKDAIAYLDGDKTKGVATIVEVPNLDVAEVRGKTGLSQDRFAGAFAINASTGNRGGRDRMELRACYSR
jgi:DNA-binding transcriptional regulator YiaG